MPTDDKPAPDKPLTYPAAVLLQGGPARDRLDLVDARRLLDAEHYGLEKIKRRIVEYLGVRKLAPGHRPEPELLLTLRPKGGIKAVVRAREPGSTKM